MKPSIESAAEKAARRREQIELELGEQFGGETEEELSLDNLIKEIFLVKNFNHADHVKHFDHGKRELITLEDKIISRSTLNPGWKWSTSNKVSAKTQSCMERHCLYIISGVLKVKSDQGEECELSAGDVSILSPGHDAWVVGDQDVVALDLKNLIDAKKHLH